MKRRYAGIAILTLVLGTMLPNCGGSQEGQPLARGITLQESGRVRTGTYLIPNLSEEEGPVVTIRGRYIDLDFQGAVLQGMSNLEMGQPLTGTGVCLDQASQITLRNLTVRGYAVGLECKSCLDLTLVNVHLEENLEPMRSTVIP